MEQLADLSKPTITAMPTGYQLDYVPEGFQVNIARLYQDGRKALTGELQILHRNGQGDQLLHSSRIDLLSMNQQATLERELKKTVRGINHAQLVKDICTLTIHEYRRTDDIDLLGDEPEDMTTEYLLNPLLEKNQLTTLFAPGGSGKSYFADYLAVLVQYGVPGIGAYGFVPQGADVLYLDWEANRRDHAKRIFAIKTGLQCAKEGHIQYKHCDRYLPDIIDEIRNVVLAREIGLVIVDSQMAAAGFGYDQAGIAQAFYNACHSLKTTVLVIDHTTKSAMGAGADADNRATPYGSVVKFNRSRSVWEIDAYTRTESNVLEFALHHRKHNEGMLHKPLGIRITFENDAGTLKSVRFTAFDLTDNAHLTGKLKLQDRILNYLRECSGIPQSVQSIAEALNEDPEHVRPRLNQHKNRLFVAMGTGRDVVWGIKADE